MSKNILIVDDEDQIVRVFSWLLRKEGYAVFSAGTCVEAREIIKKDPVDLVLLDINMPEVDGATLYDIIQAFHPDVKVIVSSVYPLEVQRQRVKEAADYYDKSAGLSELLSKVKWHLGDIPEHKKVVVIDDEVKVRVLMTHMLEKAGYDAVGFADNTAALNFLRGGHRVDLFILDLAMPKIDGCHFYEMIRIKHPRSKILVASNYPVESQQFYVFNADGYFDKSEGGVSLLEQVRKIV